MRPRGESCSVESRRDRLRPVVTRCSTAHLRRRPVAPALRLALSLALAVVPRLVSAQNAVDTFYPGANSDVDTVALQADGKILVGGSLTMLGGGGTGTTARNRIGRINADGSLDNAFNPGANSLVFALAVQPDGKILVGGGFTMIGGGCSPSCTATRMRIARLLDDGSVDPVFNPGANGSIRAIAVQADGKILIGGAFTGLGGCLPTCTYARSHLARLNADGTVDETFDPGLSTGASVNALVVQPDGRILIGGFFTTIGGGGLGSTPRRNIARIDSLGNVDSFDPGTNNTVVALALQGDGKVLVSGSFTTIGGGGTGSTSRSGLARVTDTGLIDGGFDPGVNGAVEGIVIQNNGKITVVGDFSKLGGGGTGNITRNGIGKLFPDGSVDLAVNPGASSGIGSGGGSVIAAVVQPDQKIVVIGSFVSLGGITGTSPRTRIGRLLVDGSAEPEFKPGADATVQTLAVQPDGKIVVGGLFTNLGGILGTTARHYIGRLNPDGSVDMAFNPGANGWVTALAVQPDGYILVGGQFTMIGGGGTGNTPRNRIARLDPTGAVDMTFDPGANGIVHEIVVLPDGKILVAGDFQTIGGGGTGTNTRSYLARLNANGSFDATFDAGVSGFVRGIAVQADGKILLGGNFLALHAVTRYFIGRVNADGALDSGFNPGADNQITAFVVQPDGNIIAGGDFTMIGGGDGTTARTHLARLLSTGVVDLGFDPGANVNYAVNSMALQTDGRVIVAGGKIRRLTTSGALDGTFDPGINSTIHGVAILPSGTVLAVGDFFMFGGGGGSGTVTNFRVGEVPNTGPATQNLSVGSGGTTITWLRGGAGPAVWRTTFESSLDGTTFTFLGNGIRIAGGWQLTGQSVPTTQSVYIRARAYYEAGNYDGSGSILERVRNPYLAALPFTDDPLVAGVTSIKAVHIVELRARIDALRRTYGIAAFPWADPSLSAGWAIRWQHIIDLRHALYDVYAAAGLAQPSYTDPNLQVGMRVMAAHVQEIRNALAAIE